MSNIINATEADFDTIIAGDMPVLVDFWATWCQPCVMIAPTLDELADDYAGRAKIVKVDVTANPELATRFGIRSIPNFIVFKNGEKVANIVGGNRPKSDFSTLLDQHL